MEMPMEDERREEAPVGGWLWRAAVLAGAAAAVAASIALRRRSRDVPVLAANEDALRRACLGTPLPILLRGRRPHRACDEESGTQSLAYHLPAPYPADEVLHYYDDHLRREGFHRCDLAFLTARREARRAEAERARRRRPADEEAAAQAAAWEQWLAEHGAGSLYADADGLRAASVLVSSAEDGLAVTLTVRPIPA